MADRGELEAIGQDWAPASSGTATSSVCLRVDAGRRCLPVVAAVAAGAAEALDLELEPATRLRTISVEAAGNAIGHAYPDAPGGPLEFEIGVESEGDPAERRIHVRVHDEGVGMVLPPTGAHPAGLGMPIISSLAESYTLTSGVEGGTTIDATIVPGADPDVDDERIAPAATHSCELSFGDDRFLQPVLGRALAAQVSGERIDIDDLSRTIDAGDAIARTLESAVESSPGARVLRISRWRDAHQIRISIGPLVEAAIERMTAGVRSAFAGPAPLPRIIVQPAVGGAAMTLITLPL